MAEERNSPKRKLTVETSALEQSKSPTKRKASSRREKESMILHELSSAIHTMQHLSSVLEDVVTMTNNPLPAAKRDTKDPANVIAKQQALSKELQQWQKLISQDFKEKQNS